MNIRLTTPEEIKALTTMSKRAFDTDILVGAPEIGGPPNYDNEHWHEQMMIKGHLHTVTRDGQIIGGVILFPNDQEKSIYLGRIFLDPNFHGKGYGLETMKELVDQFSAYTVWYLDTPIWNRRTNAFYKKLGFTETSRDEEAVNYRLNIE